MLLDKNSILSAQDLKRETVPCPEWGGDIIVQEISAVDRDRLWPSLLDSEGKNDPINLTSKVLVRCIVTADGNRMFTDDEAESLGKKSTDVLNRLFKVAEKLNALTVQDDAIKNSAPGLSDNLLSDCA